MTDAVTADSGKDHSVRKLCLQMQISIDGFVDSVRGEQWQIWNWGPECTWDRPLQEYFNAVYRRADTVLLSRDMAENGFIDHWREMSVSQAGDPAFDFARRVGQIDKVIATRETFAAPWDRTRVIAGDLAKTVLELKSEEGADILAFGGVRLATNLLALGLVDELQLFVNPAALGGGSSIFGNGLSEFALLGSDSYGCGIVVNRYAPRPHRTER